MKIVLLGPPGAGKGTQAKLITDKLNIPQISTGDILRKAIKEKSEMGKRAQSFMDSGALVPDEIVIGIINERITEPDCSNGYILDGFPRTLAQAEALSEALKALGGDIDFVIDLKADAENLMKRLTGRRICRECGQMFHLEYNPSKIDGKCDKCGGDLYQRDDDKEETITKRFDVYDTQAKALNYYYSSSGRYKLVDGNASMEDVSREVLAILGC
jgi:adenylate kinase